MTSLKEKILEVEDFAKQLRQATEPAEVRHLALKLKSKLQRIATAARQAEVRSCDHVWKPGGKPAQETSLVYSQRYDCKKCGTVQRRTFSHMANADDDQQRTVTNE